LLRGKKGTEDTAGVRSGTELGKESPTVPARCGREEKNVIWARKSSLEERPLGGLEKPGGAARLGGGRGPLLHNYRAGFRI